MSQQTEEPKTQSIKPGPVLVVLLAVLLLVLGGYMLFSRRTGSSTSATTMPGEVAVEPIKTPAPTVRPFPTPDVPPGLVKTPAAARFELAGLQFLTIYFDDQWHAMDQNHSITPHTGYPVLTPDLWELHARWRVFNGTFDIVQALKRTGADTFSYDAKFTSEAGVQSQLMCTEIHLPVASYAGEQVVVDGNEIRLPETLADPYFSNPGVFNKLEIATSVGRLVIEGDGPMTMIDNRQWGNQFFTIRVHFAPPSGLLKETELHLKMKVIP